MIKIHEIIIADKRQRKAFFELPYKISSFYSNWVPVLKTVHKPLFDPLRNPYLKTNTNHFFIAENKGETVGRIALFGPGHHKENLQTATIAFPDFENDMEIASMLFASAEEKAKSLGAARLLGPFNPNIHYDVGILTQGFDTPNTVFMGYQPQYYASFFEAENWKPHKIFQSWKLEKQNYKPAESLKIINQRITKNSRFRIRNINIQAFHQELDVFYKLYCECFATHWAFTAPTADEFKFIASDLKFLLKPKMGVIAEVDGQAAGFILGIPDINSALINSKNGNLLPLNWLKLLKNIKNPRSMRVMIAGVLPQYRRSGLHAAMFQQFTDDLFYKAGIESGEIGWVMKGNASMEKTLAAMGAEAVKEYTLYEKWIS